jgi:hypothetical protein
MIRFLSIVIALCAATISSPAYADCGKDHEAETPAADAPAPEAPAADAPAADAPAADAPAADAHKCAGCAKGKSGEAAWCEGCKVGYVDGKKIGCKTCYEHKASKGEACKEHAEAKGTEG